MKKNIKRTAAAVLALLMMTFGFAGCGQNNSSTGSASDSETSVNASAEPKTAALYRLRHSDTLYQLKCRTAHIT